MRTRSAAGRGRPPRISVVTVALNAARTLPACLESVASQSLDRVEHLVVDGGSSDASVEVLRSWDDRLAWWISEPDRGIYDAMNKGIAAAQGDWLYFLGADDVLAGKDVLARCARHLEDGAALVYGDVRYPAGRRVRSRAGPRLLLHNTVHHQAAFYARRVFEDFRYDASLQVVADYELNLKLYLSRERCVRADVVVAQCAEGGVSRARIGQAFRETNAVRRRYLGAVASAGLKAVFAAELGLYLASGRARPRG